jgi:hypothetical protein
MKEVVLVRLANDRMNIVFKSDNLNDIIDYVKSQYQDSIYLEDEDVSTFLASDKFKDGNYILVDDVDDNIFVYNVDTLFSSGYIYNSIYREKQLMDEFKLID